MFGNGMRDRDNDQYAKADGVAPSRSTWKDLANKYHILRMARANTFGKLTGHFDGVNYLLFGLSAATGKVMTQAKRLFGGDADGTPADFADALASVRIYIEQIAHENNIDLDSVCLKHMQGVLSRMDKK